MKEYLIHFAHRYGWLVMAGLIGAIVHRIRNKVSWGRFLGNIVVSSFVGLCVGVILRNYFDFNEEVVFIICSVCGVFSNDLLDECQELIKGASEYIKNKLP